MSRGGVFGVLRRGSAPLTGGAKTAVVVDVVAAGVYFAVFGQPVGVDTGLGVAVHLASTGTLMVCILLRWRYPKVCACVALLFSVVRFLLGWTSDPFLAVAWCVYPVFASTCRVQARWRPAVDAGVGVALAMVLFAGLPSAGSESSARRVIVGLAAVTASWFLGSRAARKVREQETEVRLMIEQSVAEERRRVAQDLHDTLSHTLGRVGVQAGVARYVHHDDPNELAEALREVEETSREAMLAARQVLLSLREAEPGSGVGLADFEALARTALRAGHRCTYDFSGRGCLTAADQLVAFRVVQEGVTNVLRHARGASLSIAVIAAGEEVLAEVVDDGPGSDEDRLDAGLGLVGMRERLEEVGGVLEVGNRPRGGFRVSARFPRRRDVEVDVAGRLGSHDGDRSTGRLR